MDFMTISKAFLPYCNKKAKTFNQFQHLDMSGSGLLTREGMSTHCIAQGTLLCGDLNGKASQKRGDTCIRIVIHFVVQQKLRPHCKATKLQ